MRIRKDNAVSLIQKYLRGYIGWKHWFRGIHQYKLDSTFEYFEKMKLKLQNESQIKIRNAFFRYKEAKLQQEIEERSIEKKNKIMIMKKKRKLQGGLNQAAK